VDAAADDAPKKRRVKQKMNTLSVAVMDADSWLFVYQAPAASSAAAKKPAKRSRAAADDGKEGDDGAGDGEDWAKHAANDTVIQFFFCPPCNNILWPASGPTCSWRPSQFHS
jgi:hypothetical protein